MSRVELAAAVFLQRTLSATWVFLPFNPTELLVMLHLHKGCSLKLCVTSHEAAINGIKFNYWFKIAVYIELFQEYCDLFQSLNKTICCTYKPWEQIIAWKCPQ